MHKNANSTVAANIYGAEGWGEVKYLRIGIK